MPSEPQNRLVLERFIPYRLSVLSNRISSAIADEYSERFDLTIVHDAASITYRNSFMQTCYLHL